MKFHLAAAIAGAVFLTLFGSAALAQLEMGELPIGIILKDEVGGRLDGSPWRSEELVGKKISVIFYVDPDKKDLNNEASEILKKEDFPQDKFQSYAIINMAATWLPNFVISNILQEKQKQYKTTIYVKDYEKVLVNKWGVSDNNSNVLAFDSAGKLFFLKGGKLSAEEIQTLIKDIRSKLENQQ